jgi:DNA-binding MarR family transcriptional regulator/heme-degrading monooxygenase HmoA
LSSAERIQDAVVRLIADVVLFNHAVAQRAGLGSSDAQFMTLLQVHGPLTPGRLAELSGLTTGSVTGVLDRLERGGFVQRTRSEGDRRKVLVQLRDDVVAERLAPHYRDQAERLDALLRTRTPEELAVIEAFLRDLVGDEPAGEPERPAIARIWRGRTPSERADEYEAYNYEAGIRPLIEMALGVQTFRDDRENESEFITISYWESVEAMSEFTGADPTQIHHLDRDEEFLIELPQRVQIVRLRSSHGVTG